MVEKKKQTMRYSDDELSLMKATFADSEPLLMAIRKVMHQGGLSKTETGLIKDLRKEVLAVIRKSFKPELDLDAPISQVGDLWYWLPVQLQEKTPELMHPFLLAREKIVDYIEQQLTVMEGGKAGKIKLEDFIKNPSKQTKDELYANVLTRNTIIGHTESVLQQFVSLAGLATETVEEVKKRVKSNSSE